MQNKNSANRSSGLQPGNFASRRRTAPPRTTYSNKRAHEQLRPINKVLDRLAGVQLGGAEGEWRACCPAHNDNDPSLSVSEAEDGKVLLHCFSGCELHEIIARLGLEERDIFPRSQAGRPQEPRRPEPVKRSIPTEAFTATPLQDLLSLHGPLRNAANAEHDWASIAQRCMDAMGLKRRGKLALKLGVLPGDLDHLQVGWLERPGKTGIYTFPEFNAAGEIIGISTRTIGGKKKMLAGSERGLTIPEVCDLIRGPILIVEGATDTAALLSMGLAGIGRPSAKGGVAHLAALLAKTPPDVGILVVGEMDAKPDGSWPGRDGAQRVAEQLATRLGRTVQWGLVPEGMKDTRSWLQSRQDSDRRRLGQQFVAALRELSHDATPTSTLQFVDSQSFFTAKYCIDWHIKNVLVQGQPAILGGAKKVLKTNMLVDMAISVASGTPFLGHFPVSNRSAVGLISGESGEATIQETAKRISLAKGIFEPEKLPIQWCFRLPRLGVAEELEELAKLIADHGLKLVLIDPLYLCLLAGNPNLQASNLFDVGPLLSDITAAVLGAGATPVFAHHNRKVLANAHEPPELEDLAFAGTQEFARQWLLVGRREKYEPGSGLHRLWLNVGGSTGQSGCWAVDIDEGRLADDFSGRHWQVAIRTAANERQEREKQKERRQAEKKESQVEADVRTVTANLERRPDGESKSLLADMSGLSKPRVAFALEQMIKNGTVENTTISKGGGRAGDRGYPGFRLVPDLQPVADHVDEDEYEED